MKVLLHFCSSIYDCKVIIKDQSKIQNYTINFEEVNQDNPKVLEIDVDGNDFELTVIPQMIDYKSALSDMYIQNWTDKLAKKIGNTLLTALDKTILRVGCVYNISEIEENDVIYFHNQEYIFGTFDRFDLFQLIPMVYMFFEASRNGVLCKCSNAFATNRKEVISCAKKLSLINFGIHLIITYPFQVRRIKKLTSDKKVRKTIIKFNGLSEKERQKVLDKKEKFMSR